MVLRQELVALFPGRDDVEVDVREFSRAAARALQTGDRDARGRGAGVVRRPAAARTTSTSRGPTTPRRAARQQHLDLLRLLGRWDDVLAEEPADEQAHLALARARAAAGDARGALVQLERLEQALHRELGASPSAEAVRLRTELEQERRGPTRPTGARCAGGRRAVHPAVRAPRRGRPGPRPRSTTRAPGEASPWSSRAPPGWASPRSSTWPRRWPAGSGWKVARGGASSVEGPWPYSPVLEAFSALCRRHPALLDGLADDYRTEIEQALAGRDLGWTGENSHQRLFVAAAELMRVASAGAGLLLVVDDLHDADEASLRLLHYLSRCAVGERVMLVLAHRDPAPDPRARRHREHGVARRRPPGRAPAPDDRGRRSVCSPTGSPRWTRTRSRRSPGREGACRSPCSRWPGPG